MVYKAIKLGESIFERQSEMLIPEEELRSESPVIVMKRILKT